MFWGITSFRRKPESSNSSKFAWIPAFAGMTDARKNSFFPEVIEKLRKQLPSGCFSEIFQKYLQKMNHQGEPDYGVHSGFFLGVTHSDFRIKTTFPIFANNFLD